MQSPGGAEGETTPDSLRAAMGRLGSTNAALQAANGLASWPHEGRFSSFIAAGVDSKRKQASYRVRGLRERPADPRPTKMESGGLERPILAGCTPSSISAVINNDENRHQAQVAPMTKGSRKVR